MPPDGPIAVNDTSSGAYLQPQFAQAVADDTSLTGTAIQGSTLKIQNPTTLVFGTSSVTITGQGTYTIDNGDIKFTPVANFSGTATPVTYQIADSMNQTATATYTPTVLPPAAPNAVDDRPAAGAQGIAQVIDVLANDKPSVDTNSLFDVTTLLLCAQGESVPDCEQTTVTTADGQYRVENGQVTFTPNANFTGQATQPVTYQVQDEDGQLASAVISASVIGLPVAVNDATAADVNRNQTSNVLANDVSNTGTPLAANLVKLVGPSSTLVDSVTTADGVYTLNTTTGVITFDPIDNFTGEATPVTYQVTDSMGQTATATYTPTSKAIPPRESIAAANETQYRNVLQDQTGLRPETLELLDTSGRPLSSSTVQMPEQGTFELRGAEITFTPNTDAILAKLLADPSGQKRFYKTDDDGNQILDRRGKPILIRVEADITPISFQALDSNGIAVQNFYKPVVTFSAPAAAPDFSRGPANEPQSQKVLSNDGFGANSGTKLLPETLELVAPSTGIEVGENKVRIPDEGTFTFDGESILFQPDMSSLVQMLSNDLVAHGGDYSKAKLREVRENGVYLGLEAEVTTITYTVLDEFGFLVTTTYTPRVFFPKPAATPDTSKGGINEPQRTDVIANDSPSMGIPFEADYLKIWNPVSESWGVTPVETDEGVYTVEAADGVTLQTAGLGGTQKIVLSTNIKASGQNSMLVFTPRLNWTGTATPVRYQLRDEFGQKVESTKTPTVEGESVVSAINKLAKTGGQPLQFVMALAAGLFTIGMSLKISSNRRRNPVTF